MGTKFDLVSENLNELSLNELLALQEKLTIQIRHHYVVQIESASTTTEPPLLLHLIAGAYRPTSQEIEKEMELLFTAEEIAASDKIDLANLPALPRRIVEYINEDREDRV